MPHDASRVNLTRGSQMFTDFLPKNKMEDVYDINKICRTCLTEAEEMKTIFDVVISEEHNIRIIDFMRRLTSLKITKSDDLPSNICVYCIEQLCKAFNFAQMCISTDSKLKLNRQNLLQHREVQSYQQYTVVHKCQVDNKENNCNVDLNTEDLNVAISEVEKDSCDEIILIRNCLEDQENTECIENNESNIQETRDFIHTYLVKEEIQMCYQTQENANNTVDVPKRHYTKKFKCNVCTDSFASKAKLIKHEQLHNPNNPFKCDICSKGFLKRHQLKLHTRCHIKNEDKQFVCKECGQKFSYLYLLKKHSYKHQDEKPFPCTKCDRGCITAESLRRHMRTHDEDYTKKTHVCNFCSKEFPFPSFLAEHIKNHTGEKPYLCSICGKDFRQSGTLQYHMRAHTGNRPFTCSVCNNSFPTPGVLRVHMRRHTNERPYVCDICGMAFRQSTDMKNHRRTHTGDKRVLCTVCGKRFSSTGQLTVHLRSHTGEKPYSCAICQKSFATKTALVKHQRIHTGERPYVCTTCGRAFNQSSTLKTHTNTHKFHKKNEVQNVDYSTLEEYKNIKTDILPAPVPMLQISQSE